jgi:hypothetical protein
MGDKKVGSAVMGIGGTARGRFYETNWIGFVFEKNLVSPAHQRLRRDLCSAK